MNWTPDGDDPESYRWGMSRSPAPVLFPCAFDPGAHQEHGIWLTLNFTVLPGQNSLPYQVFPPSMHESTTLSFLCCFCVDVLSWVIVC